MSKKFKLDLIVCLYYRGNLIVRLAWNVPSDGEGLRRQKISFFTHFHDLRVSVVGLSMPYALTSEKEMKFNLTCLL